LPRGVIDVLTCPWCGEKRKLIALLTDGAVVRRILEHLGLPTSGANPWGIIAPAPRDALFLIHTQTIKKEEMIMRYRIEGAIGVVLGGWGLGRMLLSGNWVTGSGATAAGQIAAIVVLALFFGGGLYYLIRGAPKANKAGSPPSNV